MVKRRLWTTIIFFVITFISFSQEANANIEDIWYVESMEEHTGVNQLRFTGTNLNGEQREFYVQKNRTWYVWPMSRFTPMFLELKQIEPGLPAHMEIKHGEKHLLYERYEVERFQIVEIIEDPDDPTNPIIREGSGILNQRLNDFYNDPENRPSMTERSMADPLIGLANFMLRILGMQDITLLVFGKNPNPTEDRFMQGDCTNFDCRDGNYLGVLSEGMMQAVEVLHSTFERFLPYPLFFALMLIGFLILMHSMSAQGRSKSKDYIMGFILALIAIRFGHFIWMFAAWIAHTFTDIIWFTLGEYGVQPNLFLNMIWGAGSAGYYQMTGMRSLGVALLVLVAAGMTAVLNWQYAIRSIMLMVLMVIFVPACVISIFPKFRHALNKWFEQFIANLFMPCAHAVALGLFFLLLRFSSDGVSMWIIFGYFFGLPMVVVLFRQLLGMQEESGGFGNMLGTMVGISAVTGVAKVLRSDKKHQSAKAGNFEEGGLVVEREMSSESGLNRPGNVTNAEASSPISRRAGQVMRGAGKLTSFGLKAAGVVGGATVGTMITGNPAAGMIAGATIGKGASNVVDSISQGMSRRMDTLSYWDREVESQTAKILLNEAEKPMESTSTYDTTEVRPVQSQNTSEWMGAQGMRRTMIPSKENPEQIDKKAMRVDQQQPVRKDRRTQPMPINVKRRLQEGRTTHSFQPVQNRKYNHLEEKGMKKSEVPIRQMKSSYSLHSEDKVKLEQDTIQSRGKSIERSSILTSEKDRTVVNSSVTERDVGRSKETLTNRVPSHSSINSVNDSFERQVGFEETSFVPNLTPPKKITRLKNMTKSVNKEVVTQTKSSQHKEKLAAQYKKAQPPKSKRRDE